MAKNKAAIVTVPVAKVKATPTSKASDKCVVHEGTYVEITDKTLKDWCGVKLQDGREGWMLTREMEEI